MSKICRKCGTSFDKINCPECHRRMNRECAKKFREKHPEIVKERLRQNYLKNREKRLASSLEWHRKNPDKSYEATKRYRLKNRAKFATYCQNRRNKLKGKLSVNLAEILFKKQKGKCACCGEKLGDDFHLDHIIPLALGGKNEDSNIQLLKSSCNMKKGKKHPIDYMQSKGFLL